MRKGQNTRDSKDVYRGVENADAYTSDETPREGGKDNRPDTQTRQRAEQKGDDAAK